MSKPNLRSQLAKMLAERADRDPDGPDRNEVARQRCRDGNPFPLMAQLWPSLVITDPDEAEFFEGSIDDPLDPCLRIDRWQRMYLKAAFDRTVGEIAMKGCTGAGKGGVMAMHICLSLEAYPVCRIHLTSRDFAHAKDNLFGEVCTWRKAIDKPVGVAKVEGIDVDERKYVTILNPGNSSKDAGEKFSGAHAGGGPTVDMAKGDSGETIYFFDEASAVSEDARENAIRNATKAVYASNPRVTVGMFRELYKPLRGDGTAEEKNDRENTTDFVSGPLGRRLCMTISGDICANVRYGRLKKPVAPSRGIEIDGKRFDPNEPIPAEYFAKVRALLPGQIDLRQYQARIDHSKTPTDVEVYAHARFPKENPDTQAILGSWLDRHLAAWHDKLPVSAFGLDAARSESGDPVCLAAGGVEGVRAVHKWNSKDYRKSARQILSIALKDYGIDLTEGTVPVCFDMAGGFGAGIFEPLEDMGVWCIEFQPAGRPIYNRNIYQNQRAEGYLLLGRRLDPTDNWQALPWALPPHCPQLAEDLTAPQKQTIKGGAAWKLEPKRGDKNTKGVADRLGRSPDEGDAVVCLWRAILEKHKLYEVLEIDRPLVYAGLEESDEEEQEDTGPNHTLPAPPATTSQDDYYERIMGALEKPEEKPRSRFDHLFKD